MAMTISLWYDGSDSTVLLNDVEDFNWKRLDNGSIYIVFKNEAGMEVGLANTAFLKHVEIMQDA